MASKNTKILLISDNDIDYEDLINEGFTNITYKNSIISDVKYYQKEIDELKDYDIVLLKLVDYYSYPYTITSFMMYKGIPFIEYKNCISNKERRSFDLYHPIRMHNISVKGLAEEICYFAKDNGPIKKLS